MHYVLYIPGLGDHNLVGQCFVVRKWRLFGVKPIIIPMIWNNNEPFNDKLAKITSQVDSLFADGHRVSLVGISAGGSAVINALAARNGKIHRVALICGEVNPAITVAPKLVKENPAFAESVDLLQESLDKLTKEDRARIRSYRPIADKVVPINDTKISGAETKLMPTFGHLASIIYAITLGSFGVVRWLKKS